MTTRAEAPVDVEVLRQEIAKTYTEVSTDQEQEFTFPTGRAWAHELGYPTMITDWRMTNLEASRFWPRRGFRETFLRLYRSIP